MTPSEFWKMAPREVWWLLDAKQPKPQYAGGMTETEVEELYNEAFPNG